MDEFCKQIFSTSPDLFCIVGLDGCLKALNPSWSKTLGWSIDELQAEPIIDFVHPQDKALTTAEVEKVVAGEPMSVQFENRCRGKDGAYRWLSWSASASPETDCILATARDISTYKQLEERYRLQSEILANMGEGVCLVRASDGIIVFANPTFEAMFGYEPGEMDGLPVEVVNAPTDKSPQERATEIITQLEQEGSWQGEIKNIKKDGTAFWCHATVSAFEHHEYGPVWIAIHTDIDKSKQTQQELTKKNRAIHLLQEVSVAANEASNIDAAFQRSIAQICQFMDWPVGHVYHLADHSNSEMVPTSNWYLDDPDESKAFSAKTMRSSFVKGEGIIGQVFDRRRAVWVTDVTSEDASFLRTEAAQQAGLRACFAIPVLVEGNVRAVMEFYSREVVPPDKSVMLLMERIGIQLGQVIKRSQAEQALQESQADLVNAQQIAQLGSWETNIATGASHWSDEAFRICGFAPGAFEPTAEARSQLVHPDDREMADKALQEAIEQNKPYRIEKRIVRPSGEVRHVLSQGEIERDERGRPQTLRGVILDITERKLAEQAVAKHMEKLAYSNAELEQFAYVASHDLREPLRSISSYLQLLERRYRDKLDDGAKKYIDRSVAATERMRALINALLAYSRITRQGQNLQAVDCNKILAGVQENVAGSIKEHGATVSIDPLPTLTADPDQLAQLFQNLVGNAIKFRGDEPPVVNVGAKLVDGDWLFWVKDNGIGMKPKYTERIFEVFERLHGRGSYAGTGIGLAICHKIVERHNGRIWVETALGQGSTFFFTLPATE